MDNRLYLIDGSAFAYRSFYGVKGALSDSAGRPTNAVYGFTRVLLKILRERNPSHIAVVFDAGGITFRHEMYAEYKANRRETPPELSEQFPRMFEVVEALNLPLLREPGIEADDVIGTLARRAEAKGLGAVIVSGDKDLLQLVSPTTVVFDPSRGDSGEEFGPDTVQNRMGVGAEHVIDLLALMGDSSDNVPGVRGIGEKTAQKLLADYHSLDGVYANIAAIKGKVKENLIEHQAMAELSKRLVTIEVNAPLALDPEDCHRGEPHTDRLIEVFKALGFNSLLEQIQPTEAAAPETLDYRLILTEPELAAAIGEMRAAGVFAVDTETTSVDPMRANIVGLSMSARPATGYYVPLGHDLSAMMRRESDDDLFGTQLTAMPKERALTLLKPLLEDPSIGKTGHNIKYDLIVLQREGIAVCGIVMDTMVASYLADPSRMRHNMNDVCQFYLNRATIPISDLIGKGAKQTTFDYVPLDQACEYASEDADISLRLMETFGPILRERELMPLFEDVELPLINVLARMEMAGVAIDRAVFSDLHAEVGDRLAALESEIHEMAGEPFLISSPKQLQVILFEKLKLKPRGRTKTGYSTDVEVLEELAAEHPLPAKILEFRMLDKLRTTYLEAIPKLLHPDTGRVHTSFNQAVTATGRLSSSDPNLQNIPVRTELGKRIRGGFVAGREDLRLISADYSQIELRILAHLCGDAALQEAFHKDADIHTETAARVFDVMPELVTSDMRRQAKAVNFGVVYGISAFGLARNLGISNSEAAHFIEHYFQQYPGVKRFMDETIEHAKEIGYTTTMLNRRRYLPDLKSTDQNVRRGAERAAINTPVQGTAADVIKLAMVRLDAALEGTGARQILQVHDELLVEAPADRTDDIIVVMREVMENALPMDVPLRVDVRAGSNWAEIH